MLLPRWTTERKRKDITAIATRIQCLTGFELSALLEVLSQQVHNMTQQPKAEAALETKSMASKKLISWLQTHLGLFSNEVYSCHNMLLKGGGSAATNDVVLLTSTTGRWDAGKVLLHFGIGNEAWSLLRTLELVEYFPKDRAALWNETSNWVPVPASEILTTVTHTPYKGGVLTLVPLHLR